MSATISTAIYAWCDSCADGSEVGVSTGEAKAWAVEHNKWNHEEDE